MSLVARLDAWVRPVAPAARLGAMRVLVGAFGAVYCTVRAPNMASVASLHDTSFAPVGVVSVLDAPLPAAAVWALVAATVALSWAFAFGYRHRVLAPAFALLLLWVVTYRNSFGKVFHTEHLWVLHVMVLAIVPSADAYALDARGRDTPAPSPRYGWPLFAMGLATAITYALAGVAKLRAGGLGWVASDALRNWVAEDNLRKIVLGDTHSPLGGALVRHPWVFKPLAVATLVLELGAPLALLGRRPAAVLGLGIWAFHLGVLATMAIFFPYPLLGVAFAPWFALEVPAARLAARFTRARGASAQNESPPDPSR